MGTDKTIWDNEKARSIVRDKADMPGALLPVLHALQDCFGYINPDFVPDIATILNLSRADVHGVISFYHDFRDKPPAKRVLRICRAEACQAMAGEKLSAHAKKYSAGDVTFEPVYCLGNCACAPAVMMDGKTYGRITPERLDKLIAGGKK